VTPPPPPAHPHASSPGVRAAAAVAVILLCAVASGCFFGPRNFENENDRLRKENLELRERVAELEAQLLAARDRIDNLERRISGGVTPNVPGVAPSDVPQASELSFGRFLGLVDDDEDGVADVARVYLIVRDQFGRVMPVAGSVRVRVVVIPSQGEPRTLGMLELVGEAFAETYRQGLTGAHYTLRVPIAAPGELGPNDELVVRALVTDAATGRTLTASKTMSPELRD